MNTVEERTDMTGNRARALPDGPILAERRYQVASPSAGVCASRSATAVPTLPTTTWRPGLTCDVHGSHLVNFPFAFTAITFLTTGLVVIGWGMALASGWLAIVGFLLTLAGGAFYGWSLCDE